MPSDKGASYLTWNNFLLEYLFRFYLLVRPSTPLESKEYIFLLRAVFTWLSKGIGFGFGFGFTAPFGWLVYLLWIWFYDSQVKTALLFHGNGQFWPSMCFSIQTHHKNEDQLQEAELTFLIFFPHGIVIRQQIFIACLALLFNKHAFIPTKNKKKKYKNYIHGIIRLLILNSTFIMEIGSNSLS